MAQNEIVSQYYNGFDATKGYSEVMFRAGKVLQSKELNEMQSIIRSQIANIGNTILTNGDVVEGCQLLIAEDRKSVTVTAGRIYIDGNVMPVETTTLAITGSGNEIIGAVLREGVITSDDDPDLIDPATGWDNYNQDGAYRMKQTVEIVLNNSDAAPMFSLVNGEQLSVNKNEDLTQLEKIQNTLARRTYDESGNYKVSGLDVSDREMNDDEHIFVSVAAGKAYVKGYEVQRDSAYTVLLNRPTALRDVENEPKTYRDGQSRYTLNNNFINSVKKVVGIIEATQNITRGSIIGGTDFLLLNPVVEIVEITQGTTTYTQGVDFQLTDDGVDWSIGSKAPAGGSTYQVVWTYNKQMIKDVDWKLTLSEDNTAGYIDFLSGDRPTSGSTVLINYDFLLNRIDVISLDQYGNLIVTEGQPNIARLVSIPNVDSTEVLPLASVALTPLNDTPVVTNNKTQAISMLDMYNILERLNEMEYNQAITDLDQEAAEGENATQLMGVFTDGFIGLSKADVYHELWDATIDLENEELTLPYGMNVVGLKAQANQGNQYDRLLMGKANENLLFEQAEFTNVLRINSYNAFPKSPSVHISPAVDNWIDESTITVDGGRVTTSIGTFLTWSQFYASAWYKAGNRTGTTTKSSTSYIDQAITYMRQIQITVTVNNLEPSVDNVVILFNNQEMTMTPTTPAFEGSDPGRLKANASGYTSGRFTIPEKTLCGTVEVRAYAKNTPSLVGITNFTANGTKRTITKKVWTETTTVRITDPLAQSFQFEMDQIITGVGLYFNDKDSTEPITVQVRNMVNGYPGTTVYTEKVISPSNIKTSAYANQETKVVFDNPVYCEANTQYCFTVLSNSDTDSVWVAETNKKNPYNNTLVTKNPFLNGMLFSSSNAITWSAHQAADMKFKLYGLFFNGNDIVLFEPVNGVNFDRMQLISDESVPAGCSIQWQYQLNNEGEWLPLESYESLDLETVGNTVRLRAVLKGTTTITPTLALDSLILAGSSNNTQGNYISKNVGVPAGFNHVKVVCDLNLPTGTNALLYYSTDETGSNWKPLNNTGVVVKSAKYKTYTFEDSLSEKAYNYRVRVALSTVNSANRPTVKNLRSIMKTV